MYFISKRFFLLVFLISILTSCEFKDLSLNGVSGFNVDKVGKSGVLGTIQVDITNPNSYGIKVTGADFDVYSNGAKIGTAHLNKSFKIKSNSTKTYPVQLEAKITNILAGGLSSIIGALSGKAPKVKIKGDLKARVFLYSKKVPVDFETEFPMNLLKR